MQGLSWNRGWFYGDGVRIAAWKAEQSNLASFYHFLARWRSCLLRIKPVRALRDWGTDQTRRCSAGGASTESLLPCVISRNEHLQ